jgi:hypothetical protein
MLYEVPLKDTKPRSIHGTRSHRVVTCVDEKQRKRMRQYSLVNWSEVTRTAIDEILDRLDNRVR